MNYIGDFLTGSTVNIFFTTNDAAGAAVAPSSAFEVADVRLYKGSSATERTSQSGWTMTSPFDAITGLHVLAIDLSDNTDAGFYAAGNDYTAVLSPDETVDGQTIVAVLAQFSIENRSLKTMLGADNKALISTDAQDLSTTLDVRTKTITAGAITAAAIATGAIDADATAADFLAEINAEVVDALATDTYAEPGQGAPAATATLAAKINYLYKSWRNKKTQTATTFSLFADDASTVDQKSTVSEDGTTATVGEMATGP